MATTFSHLAKATEWTVLVARGPIGILRRLDLDHDEVFRAVAWAPTSDGRELIGYYDTVEDARQAVWVTWATTKAQPSELAISSSQRVAIPGMPAESKTRVRPAKRTS